MQVLQKGVRCDGKKELMVDNTICRKVKEYWDVISDILSDYIRKDFSGKGKLCAVSKIKKLVYKKGRNCKNSTTLEIEVYLNIKERNRPTVNIAQPVFGEERRVYDSYRYYLEALPVDIQKNILTVVNYLQGITEDLHVSYLSFSWENDEFLPSLDFHRLPHDSVHIEFSGFDEKSFKEKTFTGKYENIALCNILKDKCKTLANCIQKEYNTKNIGYLKYSKTPKKETFWAGCNCINGDCEYEVKWLVDKINKGILNKLNDILDSCYSEFNKKVCNLNINLMSEDFAIIVSKSDDCIKVRVD